MLAPVPVRAGFAQPADDVFDDLLGFVLSHFLSLSTLRRMRIRSPTVLALVRSV
jgi:hypothetical protein